MLGALVARGVAVRAVVRSEAGAKLALAAGAERAVHADLADRRSLLGAFGGLGAVHVVPPLFDPREEQLIENAVWAAESAGVDRFAYHSVLHPHTPEVRHHMRKAAAEAHVRGSRLEWTILQPAMYIQTLPLFLSSRFGARREAELLKVRVPYDADAVFTPVDLEDIAAVSVRVLTEAGHHGATYELAGPERGPLRQFLEQAAQAQGERITIVSIPPTDAVVPAEWSHSAVADVAAMWAHYDRHGLAGNPHVLELLLGRPATSVAAALRRDDGAG